MKFGILLRPTQPISKLVNLYQAAEAAGIDYGWVPDQSPSSPYRDPYVVFMAIGTRTKQLKLGFNIMVPYTHHPAILAFFMKSCDELFPGRLVLGIGPGGAMVLKPLGLKMWNAPLTAMREAITICRGLLSGEEVTLEGKIFRLYQTRLYAKPEELIPLHLGARGPQMLRLAGEMADGASCTLPAGALDWGISHIKKGLRRAHRLDASFDISNHLSVSIATNRDLARESVKREIIPGILHTKPEVHVITGVSPKSIHRLREAVDGAWNAPSQYVTDEMIDQYSISGTPDDVVEKIRQYERHGVTIFDFMTPLGPDPVDALTLIRDQVIPSFR